MTNNQEGFTIADEKLTYTNVAEDLDEDSILSEYVMAEEMETFPPAEKNHSAVASKSEEVQEPSSPKGSDLSVQIEGLSESMLENLPESLSLCSENQHEVTCDDSKDRAVDDRSVHQNTDDKVPEEPTSSIEIQTVNDKRFPAVTSCLRSFIRLSLLAILVSGCLCTLFNLSWSSGEGKKKMSEYTIENGETIKEYDTFALLDDHTDDLLIINYDMDSILPTPEDPKTKVLSEPTAEDGGSFEVCVSHNNADDLWTKYELIALSVIPILENSESGWQSVFVRVFALALSLYSVSFLTSKQSKEETPNQQLGRKSKSKVSMFQDMQAFLIECKKGLRRNGRRSSKAPEIEGYDTISYDCLSVEDLRKILNFFDQPFKGSKQCLVKAIITAYSRRLAFLTKAQIGDLLTFHGFRSLSKHKKAEMINALVEAAF